MNCFVFSYRQRLLQQKTFVIMFCLAAFTGGCGPGNKKDRSPENASVRLMTLAPGHFHAALAQKSMYSDVSPQVYVYAPEGEEVKAHLALIDRYNSRAENPTHWQEKVYTGRDYFTRMLKEKPGNVVVIAGNNQNKTEYIKESVDAGLNVLADKPMAIDDNGFELLKSAFASAQKHNVLLYDIMTERYEITSILQKAFSRQSELFGLLQKGTLENPAVTKESVHHFFKVVSGAPLIRPAWYYDTNQQGEGLVDVTTHLVDLVQWECFPDEVIDYRNDIRMLTAKHWPTAISPEQYRLSTKQARWPDYLRKSLKDSILQVYANGEMNYTLKGIHIKIAVRWDFDAPEGAGDTHYSVLRGSRCNLVIRQGAAQQYKPVLYIEQIHANDNTFERDLNIALRGIQKTYPGLALKPADKGWEVVIPARYKTGHEEHFAQVTQKYLQYIKEGKLPEWEMPNMLAKYYTTTQALKIAKKSK